MTKIFKGFLLVFVVGNIAVTSAATKVESLNNDIKAIKENNKKLVALVRLYNSDGLWYAVKAIYSDGSTEIILLPIPIIYPPA